MPVTKRAAMSLEAMETLTVEVISEGVGEYERLMKNLRSTHLSDERYRDLLCDLSVAASILETKAKIAAEAIDEYLDSLPDEED